MRRILAGILVALLALSACQSGDVNTEADQQEAGAGGDPKSARVGQPVTIEGNEEGSRLQVTVKRVVQQGVKSTDGFSVVEPGTRLVAVQFRLVNTGKVAYEDAPSNGAKVVNKAGEQFETDIMFDKTSAGAPFPTLTKLAPGNKALGFLVFSVPAGAKIAQVQFSMDSGFGDTAQWNVR